jgi:hypothetical protein
MLLSLLWLGAGGRPAAAQSACPQIEPYLTIASVSNGVQDSSDQASLNFGGCVTLRLVVVRQPGGPQNVTLDPNTRYFSSYGTFTSKNVLCVSVADCGKQFPVYAVYHDPCTGTDQLDTAHITVAHCPVVAPAAGCPQIEPYLTITEVSGGTKNAPDQATLSLGGCVTLQMLIVKQSGHTTQTVDVTKFTHFFTDPARGTFSGTYLNVFCITDSADCNRQFPIYGDYLDPCTGTHQRDTVHITVSPCEPVP